MLTMLRCCKPVLPLRLSPLLLSRIPPRESRRIYAVNSTRVLCFSAAGNSQNSIDWNSRVSDGGAIHGERSVGEIEFWLYNTMSRQKELFKPKVPRKVGMYVCGVTAYDLSHIGHARAYVTFDVLYRYLKYLGYDVCYVRNFTDVDDKDS